ncbi:putative Ankyrin-3 [Glarea lozoyensis 74030]|uniref:Putative Ankyrin-3 n=1 Tax=Glarea lozoyensis (strain ATCC 74030 / MF5533) TaxID=1104152 RepID=H0EYV7_GLAL7|nr:putative Ankyrin-3 [Glarea lozoyensis 74030]
MTAAWKNHYHILNSLIKHGADVNAKDLRGRNVLHNLAADKCNNWGDDVIEVLLRQNIYIDDEEGQDELQRTPLHWACVTGKKRLVEQLLTRPKGPRAKIDAVEVREKTGLHLASAHDRDNIVEFLISNGANVHARSDGGWTPLHNACAIGSEKIVRLVVEAGADVNGKLLNGMTPLHLAAEAARDTFGSTPFLRAAQNKRKDISTPRAVKVVEADAKDENPRPLPPPPTIVVNGAADARSVTTPRTPTRGSTSASGDDWLKDTPGSGKEHGKGSQKEKSKKGHDKAQTKGSKSPKIGSDNATPKNSKEQRKATYLHQSKAPRSPSASGRRDAPLMLKENIVMVDQLWMWVLGKDLVVTSFPQRWQQPKNDPLNVLDSIIEDINDKTRDPVKSVYDLAMIVTSRCTGVFDRHRMGDEDYQFLDMFESSIGNATDKETLLFKEFNEASAQASAWLQHNRRLNRPSRIMQPASYAYSKTHDPAKSSSEPDIHNFEDFIRGPMFVDKLLDIGQETDLLAETKDIRDELNMIKKVLEDQQSVIPTIEAAILDIYQEEKRNQQEVKKRFAEQMKTVLTHIKDIDRMDKQAERIYASVTDMLDLKQKHANAFEARFARDQATSTARQSQTVMVFTIVTIVFLPMSFIAAFFAINIREFQQRDGGLGLGYVSKYMFGIGLSISIPMIFVAFYLDDIGEFLRRLRNWNSERKRLKRQRHYSGNGEVDGLNLGIGISGLEAMRMEQVLSVRKSADTEWVRERLSMGQRPATARSSIIRPVMKREITGFRMRESGDIERGNL